MKRILKMYCNTVTKELVIWIEGSDGQVRMVRLPESIHRHMFW